MKRKNFIIVIACLIICLLLTGCDKKKLSVSDFNSMAVKNDFKIIDVSGFAENYDHLSEISVIENANGWRIEFFVTYTTTQAVEMFELNKTTFEKNKEGVSTENSNEGSNYSTYALTSGDLYMYVSRVDNTMLYLKVDKQYKDAAIKYVKKLGY